MFKFTVSFDIELAGSDSPEAWIYQSIVDQLVPDEEMVTNFVCEYVEEEV